MEMKLASLVDRDAPPIIVPLRIESVESFFDPFDPSPLEEKKLNETVEKYLVDAVKLVPFMSPVKIRIYVPKPRYDGEKLNRLLEDTVHRHFAEKTDETVFLRRRQFRRWRFNLVDGLLFLMVCIGLSQFFGLFPGNRLLSLLKESFGIVGWVALWEPASFILYGWRDAGEDIKYYVRLTSVPVDFMSEKKQTPPVFRSFPGIVASFRDRFKKPMSRGEDADCGDSYPDQIGAD